MVCSYILVYPVAPSDYTEISRRLLTFNSTTSFLSVTVEIIGDNVFEALEVFTASLSLVSPNASSQISINPQQTDITIEDDESKPVCLNIEILF